jgi:hypothetical protein
MHLYVRTFKLFQSSTNQLVQNSERNLFPLEECSVDSNFNGLFGKELFLTGLRKARNPSELTKKRTCRLPHILIWFFRNS